MQEMLVQEKKGNHWWSILWTLLGINGLIIAGFWTCKLTVPHMLDFGELEVMNAVYWWRRGVIPPYTSSSQLPTFANHYGPVYEGLCALLPSPIHPYFIGRILSLLATVALLLTVTFWVFRWTRSWTCGFLAALLLLTAKPVFTFGIVHRVDAMAVGLSVAGFVLVLSVRHPLLVVIGSALMALGFHTKLTIVAAPIACIIALWNRERSKAILVGGIWLMLTIGGIIILQLTTNGNYLRHAVLGNEPSLWLKPFDMLTRPLTSSPFWVVLAFYAWRKADSCERSALRAELLYLAVALAIAGITSTNPGSSWNYLLDFYVALAMLTGRLIWLMMQKAAFHNTLIIALLLAHALFSIPHTTYFNAKDWASVKRYGEEFVKVKAQLHNVLTHSRRYSHRIAVLKSGLVMDVALSYRLPNHIALPGNMQKQMEDLAMKALQQGQLDLVIVGDTLEVLEAKGMR